MAISKLQGQYAEWLLTTKRDRELHGLPTSDQAFADLKGVTARTLRRWRSLDEFNEYLDGLRAEAGRAPSPAALKQRRKPRDVRRLEPAEPPSEPLIPDPSEDPEFDDMLSPDEQQYAIVKAEIARQAAGGDAKAVDIYLKHWGEEHLRRERQENERLAGMSDVQLVREVVQLLGTETVASVLLDL